MKTRRTLLAATILISCAATLPADDAGGSLATAALAPAREGEYTGQRIDISLKDAELREFFRLIQEVSGQTMVVDPSVASKRITLERRDIPWDEALAIVGKTNHLGRMIDGDGDVIRILPIVDDPPRIALTRARLAADLGDRAEAIQLFEQLGAKGPMDVRCEAVVRQGALLVEEGQRRDGYALYRFVDSHCSEQPEAMRLLVEAVTGVQQDPQTWRGRTEKFMLDYDPAGGNMDLAPPRIRYLADVPEQRVDSLPADGEEWNPSTFTGEPISITMKDADFPDIMRLFSSFSGMRIDIAAEAQRFAKPVSLELKDVPWDQALHLVLQTNRLRAVRVDGGLRIEPLPDAGVTSP